MRWYAVQAFSGYEKSVLRSLEERIARSGMEDKFGQILVPVEEVIEMKGGQKAISERKLYPGYVMVQMEMTDDTWHLVKSTPRVTGFIGGTAQKPTPIRDKEVEIILQRMDDSKNNPTQKLTFEKGESVRVIDGPFKDFSGTVEDINYEKSKLRVTVTIFGRATPVELDFSQIEKEV
jgi:transcriptional antiterminator NusG